LDAHGKPIAWTHRLVGPSILARWAPPAFKDGLDGDALDGAVHLIYDIPAIQVEYQRHEEPVLNTGFWRGVGVTHNTFVIESFIDELAVAAKADPFEYRRALLGKSPRARAVLELAAKQAGWGAKLPAGRGRGIALMYSGWDTYVVPVPAADVRKAGGARAGSASRARRSRHQRWPTRSSRRPGSGSAGCPWFRLSRHDPDHDRYTARGNGEFADEDAA